MAATFPIGAAAPARLTAPRRQDLLPRGPRSSGLGAASGGGSAVRRAVPVRPSGAGRRAGRLPASVYWRRRLVALAVTVLVAVGAAPVAAMVAETLGGSGPDLDGRPLTAVEARTAAPAATGAPEPPATVVPTMRLETRPVSRATYIVQDGDTLWSIARRLQPGGDVRPLVDALAAARGGRPLQPGERIVLP